MSADEHGLLPQEEVDELVEMANALVERYLEIDDTPDMEFLLGMIRYSFYGFGHGDGEGRDDG